jgi:hypothetical protein
MAAAFPKLHSLKLAGWRFFFSKLHPLAALAGRLRQLDLSNAAGVADSTLWSMTHLTGGWGSGGKAEGAVGGWRGCMTKARGDGRGPCGHLCITRLVEVSRGCAVLV